MSSTTSDSDIFLMRSILAVGTQFTNSACNYGVFIFLSRSLDQAGFVAFSTAVGLNLFAFAVAESGVSYIAPRELANQPVKKSASLATAFVFISSSIYLLAIAVGFLIWNFLADDKLSLFWVASYSLFFFPTLMIPAWFVNRAINPFALIVYGVVRLALLGILIFRNEEFGLASVGAAGLLFTIVWVAALGRGGNSFGTFGLNDLKYALVKLRTVMLAKGFSYSVYGSIPMIVGIAAGNATAAAYVTGERFKALYATIFQPIVLAGYIKVCELENPSALSGRIILALLVLNAVVLSIVYYNLDALASFLFYDKLGPDSGRQFFLLAATLSVCSTVFLYFRVFVDQAYGVFTRAVTLQSMVFVAGAILLFFAENMPIWSILVVGEASLLVSLLAFHRRYAGRNSGVSAS